MAYKRKNAVNFFAEFAEQQEIILPVTILEETETEPAFIVQAAYLSGEDQDQMDKDCRQHNRGELDRDKFGNLWVDAVVKDFSGLTAGNFGRLLPTYRVDPAKFKAQYGEEMPYSHKNALRIYKATRAQDFEGVIVGAFRRNDDVMMALEEQSRKNSGNGSVSSLELVRREENPPGAPEFTPNQSDQ